MDAKEGMELLAQIVPQNVLEEGGQGAIAHNQFRRRVLETVYELMHQQAQRTMLTAQKTELLERLKREPDMAPYHQAHIRGRVQELEAKLWKAKALTLQFQHEMHTYREILTTAHEVP